MNSVVLVTGASSGIGKAVAELLATNGHRVYGTSRNAAIPPEGSLPGKVVMIPLDVTSDASVRTARELILEREGGLDLLVNNAGSGMAGALEDTDIEEAHALFEVNFHGVHRVTTAFLPAMRERQRGTIINIGSMAGEVAIPFQVVYSSTKAALARYSQGLGMEVAPFGIRVVHIDPGDFRTGFTQARRFVERNTYVSPYYAACKAAVAVMEQDERGGADPLIIARLVERIVAGSARRPLYRPGPRMQRFLIWLMRFLPRRAIDQAVIVTYR